MTVKQNKQCLRSGQPRMSSKDSYLKNKLKMLLFISFQ